MILSAFDKHVLNFDMALTFVDYLTKQVNSLFLNHLSIILDGELKIWKDYYSVFSF